ncbi:MAG: nitrile hydratase subunit alpha [Alphaproteobacteria bacterium]|nr:nitrile hydratase subunit alpha [Alphaproteobacteria bacterium]
MSHDHDDHDHDDHDHRPPQPDDPVSRYEALEQALRELLIEKGVVTADGLRRTMEVLESASPENGARIVARAWSDPAFKELLLQDGQAAVASLGMGPTGRFVVVENTPERHNVIVCTLCSCYPRFVLGFPPAWYKSRDYRARVVHEPRAVLAEFGLKLSDDTEVVVSDSTAEIRYMVLPQQPPETKGWPEEKLAGLITRDCLIGTAVARA